MTFYWYDFETFGTDPSRDRPCQFAGIRTDENFNVIGEPLEIYCKPADDCLPQPEACLITGITPQLAAEKGVIEAEFIRRIHAEFAQPGTCVLGYNSLRFDDEVTRNTLYRNFYDPYAREWQNGNSRWDIIDMVRLTRAVRPESINWPNHADGSPSFRLEQLTQANGIEHTAAHDALSDVWATIAMARLIKSQQPKLYDFVYQHRDKRKVEQQLDLLAQKPVLHISSMYSADKGCAAVVVPIARDAVNKNAIYVYDLSVDPDDLLKLDAAQLNQRIFTRTEELPAGQQRIAIKAIHINKCPIVVPLSVATPEVAERLGLDLPRCAEHLARIKQAQGIAHKVREAFSLREFKASADPDLALYSGGFFSQHDRQLMESLKTKTAEQLRDIQPPFYDVRLAEMLFRYRARNYPQSLTPDEQQRWQAYRRHRLTHPEGGASIIMEDYIRQIADKLAQPELGATQRELLLQLQEYGAAVLAEDERS